MSRGSVTYGQQEIHIWHQYQTKGCGVRTIRPEEGMVEALVRRRSVADSAERMILTVPVNVHRSPVMGRKPIEWNTPPFADTIMAFAVYPPNNILAVAEGNT